MRTTDYEGHLITVWARRTDKGSWLGFFSIGDNPWGDDRETSASYPTEAEAEAVALTDAKRHVEIMMLG